MSGFGPAWTAKLTARRSPGAHRIGPPQGPRVIWTDEHIAKAEQMWREGKSGGEIATALGNGATRNAVIGRAHRGGWSGGGKHANGNLSPLKPRRAKRSRGGKTTLVPRPQAPKFNPTPIKPRLPPADLTEPIALLLRVMDLNDTVCRFPVGDAHGVNQIFCGVAKENDPGQPYCAFHARITRQPPSERTQRALQRMIG